MQPITRKFIKAPDIARKKEVNDMTIEELTEALNNTPGDTPMGRATRRALLARIYALMEEQEKQ